MNAACRQGAQLGLALEYLQVALPCVGSSQHGGWAPRVHPKGRIWRANTFSGRCKSSSDLAFEVTQHRLCHIPFVLLLLLLLLPLSHFSRVRLCATPETAAHQAPLSLGFSRQEHWSGLLFPSPMHESEK